MRKIAIALSLGLTLFSCSSNTDKVAVGDKTTMKIQSVYDAGSVIRGELIHAEFKVENTGESALVLADVKGSCTCTIADWSKEPIAPGETGFINAEVNTKDFEVGPITRTIRVSANTVPNITTISVKAKVK